MKIAFPLGLAALFPNRKVRAHAVCVLAICTAFMGLLATGFHHRDLGDLLQAAMSRPAFIVAAGQTRQADVLWLHDLRSEFPAAQIGLMLFSSHNTDICRRVLFDNRTGVSAEAGQMYCGQPPEQNDQLGQERALSMLKAFRK